MTILHDAAGPAGLAVNMPSPSSLLSGYALGLFAMVFAETGRAGRGPRGLIARLLARRRASRRPARQDRPMTGRPRMTAFTRARSGGQPKGLRCLP
jgi:hypothetical protein